MIHTKRITICLIITFILGGNVITMGNSTIEPTPIPTDFIWDINNLPKFESQYVPLPIVKTEEIIPVVEEIEVEVEVDISKQKEYLADYSANEIAILQRLVESEATGEGFIGKQWVANVVLNRIKDGRFSKVGTIKSVVFASGQFSVITDGRYNSAIISDETIKAVDGVLNGSDDSCGALYFFNLKQVKNKKTLAWINSKEFVEKVGNHSFYK